MSGKLNPKLVALSVAGASAVLSLVCALLTMLAPEFMLRFFGSIFHGIDISRIAAPITVSGVVTGLIAAIAAAYAAGWIFAVVYNCLLKKKRR